MVPRWTDRELDILKTNYSYKNGGCYDKLPDRTRNAIAHKAYDLGIKYRDWTNEEINLLRRYYSTGGSKKCSEFINRSSSQIRDKAFVIGISTQCKNGKSPSHRIVSFLGDNRVIAVCPIHGNVEHRLRPRRGPRCSLCRKVYAENPGVRRRNSEWQKRRLSQPKWAYIHRLRTQLRLALKSKGAGCFKLLPYTSCDLKSYLENIRNEQQNKCPSCGVSYNKSGFQIDHIIPLASANHTEEILALFALKNLSLLCGPCNSRKGKQI